MRQPYSPIVSVPARYPSLRSAPTRAGCAVTEDILRVDLGASVRRGDPPAMLRESSIQGIPTGCFRRFSDFYPGQGVAWGCVAVYNIPCWCGTL